MLLLAVLWLVLLEVLLVAPTLAAQPEVVVGLVAQPPILLGEA
jgi:hypothetical protein